MAKVICTLPNASALINGVKFVGHKLGVISEDIDDATAASFVAIQGYEYAPNRASKAAPASMTAEDPAGFEGDADPASPPPA